MSAAYRLSVWDHPRLRGEHTIKKGTKIREMGSSPLTRGALSRVSGSVANRGIIPAYAGSTKTSLSASWRLKDHPRLRGEHPLMRSATRLMMGSSPLTRGAPT